MATTLLGLSSCVPYLIDPYSRLPFGSRIFNNQPLPTLLPGLSRNITICSTWNFWEVQNSSRSQIPKHYTIFTHAILEHVNSSHLPLHCT